MDEKNKKIVEKRVKITIIKDSSILFIGTLTDDFNSLGYLMNNSTQLFQIKENQFPDTYVGLDALDILLINDFDTSKLNDKQYEAIKGFVERGGTLILGTGVSGNKTLGLFLDGFIKVKTSELLTSEINLGGKSVSKEILEMNLEGSQVVLEQEDAVLINKVDVGLGNVQIVGFDLALKTAYWSTVGPQILTSLTNNISDAKKQQIEQEVYENSTMYSLFEAMNIPDRKNLPKVGRYALVLGIYVLTVGPVLYLILKKKDKRNLMWGIVPMISIIFVAIIFSLGGKTRLKEPFVGYVSFLNIEKDNIGTNEVYFSVTAPSNKSYNFGMDKGSNIMVINEDYGHNDQVGSADADSYKTKIYYGSEDIAVTMKDYAAFKPVYFKTKSNVELAGTYESNIHFVDGTLTGNFTNHMGYDLKNTSIIVSGSLVFIGDIADGATIDIEDMEGTNILFVESVYKSDLIEKIAGGLPYDHNVDSQLVRRYFALNYYMDNREVYSSDENYLLGFAETDVMDNWVENIGVKSSGVCMVKMPIDIDYDKDGITYIPKLHPYMDIIEGSYDLNENILETKLLKVEYKIGDNEEIMSIRYSKNSNTEFDKEAGYGFFGTVKALNYSTKQYDLFFTSGVEGEIKNLTNYLDENNSMTLLYELEEDAMEKYSNTLPVLSATKKTQK
jgi:hypothetical protein